MLISTALVKSNGTTIDYPGNPLLWRAAGEVGNLLVGEYTGTLYEEDGITKAFAWESYTPPPRTFGHAITPLAFTGRFTGAEQTVIDMAGLDDATAAMPARQAASSFRQMQKEVDRSAYVQLNRPDLPGKLAQLEAAGILAAGRDDTIINAPVGSVELPTSLRLGYGLPVVPSEAELALNGGKGWLSPDDIN